MPSMRLAILGLAVILLLVGVVAATARAAYVPITITSEEDLPRYNVTIPIWLHDGNFRDWDKLANGDIFVTDEEGKPLYYYVDVVDADRHFAAIYVLIPYLPPHGTVTIYLFYNTSNEAYRRYNDPSKVFIFYDDFETWQGWTNYGSGGVAQSTFAIQGSHSLVKYTGTDPNGGYKPLGAIITRDDMLVLEAYVYRYSWYYYYHHRDVFGLVNEAGGGYTFDFQHYYDKMCVETRSSWRVVGSGCVSVPDVLRDWYIARMVFTQDTVTVEAYRLDGSRLGSWTISNAAYTQFYYVYVGGDYTFYLDSLKLYRSARVKVHVDTIEEGQWRIPIYVHNPLTIDVYNYTLVIELNESSPIWWHRHACRIFFRDAHGNPLYYYVVYCDPSDKKAKIYVKIPVLPANSITTIYMYYGWYGLPAREERAYNDLRKVFIFYEDFDTESPAWNWPEGWHATKGYAVYDGTGWSTLWARIPPLNATPDLAVVVEARGVNPPNTALGLFYDNNVDHSLRGAMILSVYYYYDRFEVFNTWVNRGNWPHPPLNQWHVYKFVIYSNKWEAYVDDQLVSTASVSAPATVAYVGIGSRTESVWDWVRVYLYSPSITYEFGEPERSWSYVPFNITVEHYLVFSPMAENYTITFNADDAAQAGYNATRWLFYLWANPSNIAVLNATVYIPLPYGNLTILNITGEAFINTSDAGYVTITVSYANGTIYKTTTVLANTSTGWFTVTLDVNKTFTGGIYVTLTLRANATTSATEVYLRNVKIYALHEAKLPVVIHLLEFKPYLEAESSFRIQTILSYLNESLVVVEYPSGVSDVVLMTIPGWSKTIPGRVQFEATCNCSVFVKLMVRNQFGSAVPVVSGVRMGPTLRAIVYEPVLIEGAANAAVIIDTGRELLFTNRSALLLRFNATGEYQLYIVRLNGSDVGYATFNATVSYAAIRVRLVDAYRNPMRVPVNIIAVQGWRTTSAAGGKGEAVLQGLVYGTYIVTVYYSGVPVASFTLNVNIAVNGSVVDALAEATPVVSYMGSKRVMVQHGFRLVKAVEERPGRMRIYVEGTGSFVVFVEYPRRPTAVRVEANSTVDYYWIGNTLVIKSVGHSTVEINVTDLYRVCVELRDKTGYYLPYDAAKKAPVRMDGLVAYGPVACSLLPPGTVTVELPERVAGFVLVNSTTVTVSIDGEKRIVVYYKVPVKIEVHVYRVDKPEAPIAWLGRMLGLAQAGDNNGTVEVYVEGRLIDYYGRAVPKRKIVVKVLDQYGNELLSLPLTTDAAGYFTSSTFKLSVPGNYTVEVEYAGDDTYVAATTSTTVSLAAPTTVVTVIPTWALVALGVVIVVSWIAIIAKVLGQTVRDATPKRFVKRA